ncbi:MAG: sodium:solute symporter family protein [Gemmatimonadales bacterium]|jgi:SSS family solute:Na+ symporter
MIDAIIVIAYLGVMLSIGWRSRRQSAESYWVADRRYAARIVAVSLIATIFGASSTMGIIGLGYSRGLTAAWWSLIGAIALIPFGVLLAARVRELEVYTLPDILKKAYGNRVAVPAAVMIAVAWCGVVAAQMTAGAILMSGILPLDYGWGLAIVAVAFVLYTYWGGQLSVIRTDAWQFSLFLGGIVVCLTLLYVTAQGHGASLMEGLPEGHLRFPVSEGFAWYDLVVFYPLIVGLPYLAGPDVYSRVLCAKNTAAARKAALMAAVAVVPISLLLAALGILIRARFPAIAAETALPTAVGQLVPVGLAGLVLAGFLAAVMSSADTTLISASTILSLNVFGAGRSLSRERQLRLTRLALVGVGGVAWAIAGFERGIISALLLGYTVFVGGVVFPTLASFLRGRARVTPRVAMAAVIVGGVTAVLGAVRDGAALTAILGKGDGLLTQVLGPRYPAVLPVLLSLVILVVGTAAGRIVSGRSQRGAN